MDSLFSFPVGLFHPLQHAGLSRRTPGCPCFGTDGTKRLKTAAPRYRLLFGRLAGGLAVARSDIRRPYETLLAVARFFLFTVRSAVRPPVRCFTDCPPQSFAR